MIVASAFSFIHHPLDEMAAFSQTIFSNAFFVNEKFRILIKLSLKFVPKGPIESNPALVHIMICRLFGAKPLSEPMLIRFTDAYMQHQGRWVLKRIISFHFNSNFTEVPPKRPIDNKLRLVRLMVQCRTDDKLLTHCDDVIMGAIASQITSLTIVYSTVYSGADQSKHQSSASLAFVWGIHRGPVNSTHKWPVTRKMFPFDDVILWTNADSVYWPIYASPFLNWLIV